MNNHPLYPAINDRIELNTKNNIILAKILVDSIFPGNHYICQFERCSIDKSNEAGELLSELANSTENLSFSVMDECEKKLKELGVKMRFVRLNQEKLVGSQVFGLVISDNEKKISFTLK